MIVFVHLCPILCVRQTTASPSETKNGTGHSTPGSCMSSWCRPGAREAEEDAAADKQANVRGFMMVRTELQRKEREELRKALRKEKKKEEMDLLEFKRQCVELLIHNHSDFDKGTSHREAARQSVARSSGATQESLRFDHTKAHLIEKTEIKGVCQHCKKRSNYRCKICRVALPPDCFSAYHKK